MLKEQALRKFKAFENFALMNACGKCSNEAMRAECLKRFTKAELVEFWEATKNLTFPETYGQTPWEVAGNVAYELAKEAEKPAEYVESAKVREIHAAAAARRGKRARPVQLGLFEPLQLTLI